MNRKTGGIVLLITIIAIVFYTRRVVFVSETEIERWYASAAAAYRTPELCEKISPRAGGCSSGSIMGPPGGGCSTSQENCRAGLKFGGSGTFTSGVWSTAVFFSLLGFKQEIDEELDRKDQISIQMQKDLEARVDFRQRLLELPSFANGDDEVSKLINNLWPECAGGNRSNYCLHLSCILERRAWSETKCAEPR